MLTYRYDIVVENAGTNYSSYSPQVPGCVATGATVEETIENMKEALHFHLEGLRDAGDSIPASLPTDAVVSIVDIVL